MKKFCLAYIILLFLFGPVYSWATIVNGDFETGNISNWDAVGPGNVYVGEENGNHFAILESGYDPSSGEYITTLSQDFEIPLNPMPLLFDFCFETTGPDPNAWFIDALTVSLETTAGNLYDFLIVDETGITLDPQASISSSSVFFDGYTLLLDISAFAGSSATIYFDLWDEDDLADSFVYIDNVSARPVPDPASILLLGSGLVGILVRRKVMSQANPT